MSIIHKTTFNPPRQAEEMTGISAASETEEATSLYGVPIELLNAIGDAMGTLADDERQERERRIAELRTEMALLRGKVEVLAGLMQGRAPPPIDLPPLPKLLETSETAIVRKVRVS
jgi:hypothetical protein